MITQDDLTKLGYTQQPDGSFARPTQLVVGRISHALAQRPARPALDDPHPRKEKGQERIVVRITRQATRLLDADNLAGGCKPLIDQLRYAGLIPDDSPEQVEITFTQTKVKKGQEGTLVELIGQILDTCLD
jgi:hypothetical protein